MEQTGLDHARSHRDFCHPVRGLLAGLDPVRSAYGHFRSAPSLTSRMHNKKEQGGALLFVLISPSPAVVISGWLRLSRQDLYPPKTWTAGLETGLSPGSARTDAGGRDRKSVV